jgi:hypothetical protein
LGERVRGVGPDVKHPFVLRNTKLWNNFWAFRPGSPSVLVEGMDMYQGRYGLYRPVYDRHAYAGLTIAQIENPHSFVQGETPKGFALPGPSAAGNQLPAGAVRIAVEAAKASERRKDSTAKPAEPAKRAVAVQVPFTPLIMNPLVPTPGLPDVSAASADFPAPLQPVDDLPPTTVITHASNTEPGKLTVRGTTADGGAVKRVSVNGKEARSLRPNFAEWEVVLAVPEGGLTLTASAEDAAGNVETTPHQLKTGRP